MKISWRLGGRVLLSMALCFAPAFAVEQAIPLMKDAPTALNYHHVPIDNMAESNEPLVDVSKFGLSARSYYAQDKLNPPYFHKFNSALNKVYVRQGVAKKLAEANKTLKPNGVEIVLLDGYRPIELQRELWSYFLGQAKQVLKNSSEEACVEFAGKFCSNPGPFKKDDWHTWPTHVTGGAVDVTLREIGSQRELFMGGIFDDASEVSNSDYYEKNLGPSNSASFAEARRNRRLLYSAMTTVGFTNYPYEWWHYDYGTQMWVMNGGKSKHAIYGRADTP